MDYLRRKNAEYYKDTLPTDEPNTVAVKPKDGGDQSAATTPPAETLGAIPGTENAFPPSPSSPSSPRRTADLNNPDPLAAMRDAVAKGALNPDTFAALKANEAKRIALMTMPVSMNAAKKAGTAVNPDIKQTGRGKSGLHALIEGLSSFFDPRLGVVRDWGDFLSRGAAAGGRAVGGLINPDWDEYADRDAQLSKIGEDDQRLKQAAQFESQMQTQEMARQNVEEDNKNAEVQRTEQRNKNLFERLTADGVLTDDDSALYFQMTGQKIPSFDKRPYQLVERNGETVQRPASGGGDFTPTNLPPELVKKPIGVKQVNADGSEIVTPMLPNDAARFKYQSDKDRETAAQRQQESIRREEVDAAKTNFTTRAEWEQARRKAQADLPGVQKAIQNLDQSISEVKAQIEQYKGFNTSDLQNTLRSLEKDRNKYQADYDKHSSVINSKPPSQYRPPTRGNGARRKNYTSNDINSIINQ